MHAEVLIKVGDSDKLVDAATVAALKKRIGVHHDDCIATVEDLGTEQLEQVLEKVQHLVDGDKDIGGDKGSCPACGFSDRAMARFKAGCCDLRLSGKKD